MVLGIKYCSKSQHVAWLILISRVKLLFSRGVFSIEQVCANIPHVGFMSYHLEMVAIKQTLPFIRRRKIFKPQQTADHYHLLINIIKMFNAILFHLYFITYCILKYFTILLICELKHDFFFFYF